MQARPRLWTVCGQCVAPAPRRHRGRRGPIAPPASVLREGTARRRHRAAHGGAPRRGLAGLDAGSVCWRLARARRGRACWAIRGVDRAGKPPPARLRLSGPSRRRVPTGVPSASTRASPRPPVAFPGLQASKTWRPRTPLCGRPWRRRQRSSVTQGRHEVSRLLAKATQKAAVVGRGSGGGDGPAAGHAVVHATGQDRILPGQTRIL
jgi:hypothetical protein